MSGTLFQATKSFRHRLSHLIKPRITPFVTCKICRHEISVKPGSIMSHLRRHIREGKLAEACLRTAFLQTINNRQQYVDPSK